MNGLTANIGEEITIHENGKEFTCKITAIKEEKPEPKFKPGDKVVPVSKTVKNPGGPSKFLNSPEKDPCWMSAKKKCGYLTVQRIKGEDFTEANGQYVYDCGNYYAESDLIPYAEPKPPTFKVGDRVRVKADLIAGKDYNGDCRFDGSMNVFKGKAATITKPCDCGKDCGFFYLDITNSWVFSPSMLEHLPIINHCPEPKTIENRVRADGLPRKYIFNGNATVCIITLNGKQFKGIAKCAPNDEWNEQFGMDLAYTRARISLWKDRERQLLSK